MYPEFEVPEDQKKAWFADRTGAIVGADLAEAVRLEGRRSRAAASRRFTAAGRRSVGVHDRRHLRLAEARASTRRSSSSTRTYPERDDAQDSGVRRTGRLVRLPGRRSATSDQLAKRIDTMFANSPAETKTDDREGVRLGLREADRRHRRDHDGDRRDRDVLHPVRHGQHDGAVDPRAHQRARRAQDARLRRRTHPVAGAARVVRRSRSSAAGSASLVVVDVIIGRRAIPTGGLLPIFHFPPRDLILGVAARARARPRHRAAAGASGQPPEDRRRASPELMTRISRISRI